VHFRSHRKKDDIGRLALQRLKEDRIHAAYLESLRSHESGVATAQSVDEKWTALKRCIVLSAKEAIPKVKKLPPRWISGRSMELVNQRRQQGNNSVINRAVQEALNTDCEEYWNELATEMEHASSVGDSKKLYRLIREASGKKSSPAPAAINDANGNPIVSVDDQLARWSESFRSLLNNPTQPTTTPEMLAPQHQLGQYRCSIDPPSRDEVSDALRKLKLGKAPGEDNIPSDLLLRGSDVLINLLHDLVCHIWSEETVPSDWSTAVIIPLFKKGSRKDCSNYRGVSLLDSSSKVLENITLSRVRPEREVRTRENQAGFRPGRGCTDQIFTIRQVLHLRDRYRQPTIVVFINFKAAFDTLRLNRDALWQLLRTDGVPDKLVRILQALYKNTNAVVRVNGRCSPGFSIDSGVRQGALTSPVLFNFAIDWVLSWAVERCRANGFDVGFEVSGDTLTDIDYADDVTLLASHENAMQSFLDQIAAFSAAVGLNISSAKSKVMGLHTPPPSLTCNGAQLENVNNFVYLGSSIAADSSIDTELTSRIGKASAAYNNLRQNLWAQDRISLHTKGRVFVACVRSVLTYGCESWYLTQQQERRIQAFEHQCLRSIARINWQDHVPTKDVYARFNISDTLHTFLKRRRLTWLGHTLRMGHHRLPSRALRMNPQPGWKCPPGRQKESWRRVVHRETKHLSNHVRYQKGRPKDWEPDGLLWLEYLEELAANRVQWTNIVNSCCQESS
jgi:sorting nexin-29